MLTIGKAENTFEEYNKLEQNNWNADMPKCHSAPTKFVLCRFCLRQFFLNLPSSVDRPTEKVPFFSFTTVLPVCKESFLFSKVVLLISRLKLFSVSTMSGFRGYSVI